MTTIAGNTNPSNNIKYPIQASINTPNSPPPPATTTTTSASPSPLEKSELISLQLYDIQSLLLLLKTPEPNLCCQVIESILKYASDSTHQRQALLQSGIIDALLNILIKFKQHLQVRKSVSTCLAFLTETDKQPSLYLGSAKLISTLLTLVQSEENIEVLDEACAAIAHIAKDFFIKNYIRTNNGIKLITSFLSSTDPDVRKSSLQIIHSLAEDYACRTELRNLEVIPMILEQTNSDFPEIQELALSILSQFALDAVGKLELRKHQAHKKLFDMLSNSTLTHVILVTLTSLLEDPIMASSMSEVKLGECLNKWMLKEDSKLKQAVASLAAVVGCSASVQSDLRNSGFLSSLVNQLSHADPAVVRSVAFALQSISKHETNEAELLKMNFPDILLQRVNDTEIKDAIFAALSSCFMFSKMRMKIRGNTSLLQDILKNTVMEQKDFKINFNYALCLLNLTEDEVIRKELSKLDVLTSCTPLLQTITTPPFLTSTLCLFLSRMVQEPELRHTWKPSILASLLLTLLKSPHQEVVRKACWFLCNLSNFPSLALDLCEQGALDVLLKLSGPLASDALDKLLDHHLSAHYWLKGFLSPSHVIIDTFYDLGTFAPIIPITTATSNATPTATTATTTATTTTTSSTPPPQETSRTFPSFTSLQTMDLRKEVIVILKTDPDLLSWCTSLQKEVLELPSPPLQAECIGNFVTHQLLGKPEDVPMHLADVRTQLQSCLVPLTQLKLGHQSHRALLFKVLCDRLLPVLPFKVSLVRGEYGLCWNVIYMNSNVNSNVETKWIVNLNVTPCVLYEEGSPEATRYIRP